jgi:hypothetical protein
MDVGLEILRGFSRIDHPLSAKELLLSGRHVPFSRVPNKEEEQGMDVT